jgi:acyl-CoA thioester hydrolase
MYEYSREVHYYETDSMKVVHHSNYVRWFEEARSAYFSHIGMPYHVTESLGVMVPVVAVSLRFMRPARFGERFTVRTRMTKYTGAKLVMEYTVLNGAGDILCEGGSTHGFLNAEYRPVSLAKALPELHEKMLGNVSSD